MIEMNNSFLNFNFLNGKRARNKSERKSSVFPFDSDDVSLGIVFQFAYFQAT